MQNLQYAAGRLFLMSLCICVCVYIYLFYKLWVSICAVNKR
jgi:hypothetical protein